MPKQGAESEPHVLWRMTPFDKSAGDNCWEQCSPVVHQLRGEQVELIVSRAKPVQSMEGPHAMHRQGDQFTSNAEGSSIPYQLESLFG